MMGDPKADWCCMGELDPGLDGRRICWTSGRMRGGSSAINDILYFRGARAAEADDEHFCVVVPRRLVRVYHQRRSIINVKNL